MGWSLGTAIAPAWKGLERVGAREPWADVGCLWEVGQGLQDMGYEL